MGHYELENVLALPFTEVWEDVSDPLMTDLKQYPRPVTGRCDACKWLNICNSNTRGRALQTSGDWWSEDPGCYFTDEEIRLNPQAVAIGG